MHLRIYLAIFIVVSVYSCNGFSDHTPHIMYKGVYTGGPMVKSFKDCDSGGEYLATDRSSGLDAQYEKLNTEKEYSPVYVELEGEKVKSGKEGIGSELDSTIIVKKVLKITREIPQDLCN